MKTGMLFLVSLFCSLYSCSYDDVEARVSSHQYFPNEVGNYWIYDVFDSVANTSSEVTIKVVSTTVIRGKSMNIWVFKSHDAIDTAYVSVNSDTVTVLARDKFTVNDTYVLPLSVGNKWNGSWIYDNYTVAKNSSVLVLGYSFEGGFNIKETARSPNYKKTKDEWFVPYIGMVTKARFEYNFGPPTNTVWYLKSWSL